MNEYLSPWNKTAMETWAKPAEPALSAAIREARRAERAKVVAWLKERAGDRMNAAEMLVKGEVLHEDDEPEYARLSAAYGELWAAADEIEAME